MIGKYVKVVLKQPNCNEWTGKQYSYTSPIDLNIGDLVLVETALQEIAVFEALCSKDIELKEMLEEYKKLQDI